MSSWSLGTVKRGTLKKSDSVQMMGYGADVKSSAANMQVFKQDVAQAVGGDNVGIQLRHVKLNAVRKGMILAKPGSSTPTNSFMVSLIFPIWYIHA